MVRAFNAIIVRLEFVRRGETNVESGVMPIVLEGNYI